jgi:hypothetical protein
MVNGAAGQVSMLPIAMRLIQNQVNLQADWQFS